MVHPLGVIGLSLNTLGALGLLRFAGKPFAGSALTEEQIRPLFPWMPDAKRQYQREVYGYRGSIALIAIGFVLQLIDLLRTP